MKTPTKVSEYGINMKWHGYRSENLATLVVLEMGNFTGLQPHEIFPISNTTLVVFIPNFTATHDITYAIISGLIARII